jgi:outer membrane protein OmpA-like peptidoglycan-associated protein
LLAVVAAAAMLAAGCSSTPDTNMRLEEARGAMRTAQADPAVRDGAPAELKRAADSLALANAAFAAREDASTVEHLAYLARQRVGLAQQVGERRSADADVARAGAERDKLRLAARTAEADAAQRSAANAQMDARSSQLQAQSAERDARASQAQSAESQRQAMASQAQSAESQRLAMASQAAAGASAQRNAMLEQQLKDLNAKKTDRGMVVTIGDVLFDTGRADLKSGAGRSIDQLAAFMKEYPQRNVLIEGFTDSVGSDGSNQALSERRAGAVRSALVSRGVATARIGLQGHGEAFPVAGNESASGRQMNRRVEVILSEDGATVAPRR